MPMESQKLIDNIQKLLPESAFTKESLKGPILRVSVLKLLQHLRLLAKVFGALLSLKA